MSSFALVSSAPLVGVPVVDIDGTFFIQGGIYIALVLLLRPLLFGPWLATRQRRIDAIDGAFTKAKELRAEADALSSNYDTKLTSARDTALSERSLARRGHEAAQAEKLAEAREQATRELDEARARIAKDAKIAREALQGKVQDLASQITEEVLGAAS